jgi:hypothetical protein
MIDTFAITSRFRTEHARPCLRALSATCLLLTGCAQGDVCEELGACAGNLVGRWGLAMPACQSQLYEPPQEIWLFERPVANGRQTQPEPAYSSWCQNLVYTADPARPLANNPLFWTGAATYGEARIRYFEDGTYEAGFTRTGTYGWSFSAACMRQHGSQVTCEQLAEPLNLSAQNDGGYSNVRCTAGSDPGSCECLFDAVTVGSQQGIYRVRGSEVDHYATSIPSPVSTMTFCQQGDSLTLSGVRNSFLYEQPGLRNMSLLRANCSDGIKGPGENGVDCGDLCETPCPL